jgi:penicillin-binding protein 1A
VRSPTAAAARRGRLGDWISWRIVLVTIGAVLLAFLLFLAFCLLRMPVGGGMVPDATPASLILESRDAAAFSARGVFRGDPITADKLPQPLADAVVAIEDRRFYDHGGIDLRGLTRAMGRNLLAGRFIQGASTITQQLARVGYLSQERSLSRKVQEAMLAIWLEHRLSKQEILARYLNGAYFGAGAWGADAAARRYFGKSSQDLSLAEAAMLAGLVRAPSALAPTRNPEGAQQRANLVLAVMQETGHATAEQIAAARATPPALRAPPEAAPNRGWFADWAEAETRRLVGPIPIDLSVRTTLDPGLQDLAERVLVQALNRDGQKLHATQAALVAIAPDGAILAAVGGRDYAASQFNRVTQARRQPGSLFKLFTYAAAMEAGWSPDQTMVDQPVQIGNWAPQNSGGGFRGAMTLRDAFANSVNTVAVQLFQQVGRDRVIAMARQLGFRGELPNVPSLALGTAESTLLEMTAAYGSVGFGRVLDPYLVQGVRGRDRAIYVRPENVQPQPALSPAAQQGMLDMMVATVDRGTGRGARLDRPVAGKTGTTQDSRDAWFVGVTADAAVGVWVGNDDNSPMNDVYGGGLPARIWHDFMAEADKLKTAAAAPVREEQDTPSTTRSRLRGPAEVEDTGTLRIGNQTVQLAGVVGLPGEHAEMMAEWLAGRDVSCEPAGNAHRCTADGRDLSELVLSNGGGRAARDADATLRRAEALARRERRGLWGGR